MQFFVAEPASLLRYLALADRYHIAGQSWSGSLAPAQALTWPPGLQSLVISNSAASYPDLVDECNRLRADLPPEVDATLRRHEAAGTTDDSANADCGVFHHRHLCRLEFWPHGVTPGLGVIDVDRPVYQTVNGPSECQVIRSIKDCSAVDRPAQITLPTLIASSQFDEATPAPQEPLSRGIAARDQVILENWSHLPFQEEPEVYRAVITEWLWGHD